MSSVFEVFHDRPKTAGRSFYTLIYFLEFLEIWKQMEVGENFKIDYEAIYRLNNSFGGIGYFFDCKTREDFYQVFTEMALNGLTLYNYLILDDWQRKMLTPVQIELFKEDLEKLNKEIQEAYIETCEVIANFPEHNHMLPRRRRGEENKYKDLIESRDWIEDKLGICYLNVENRELQHLALEDLLFMKESRTWSRRRRRR